MKPAIRILALTAMAALIAATLAGCGTKSHQVVADQNANVIEVNQSVLQDYFAMIM